MASLLQLPAGSTYRPRQLSPWVRHLTVPAEDAADQLGWLIVCCRPLQDVFWDRNGTWHVNLTEGLL